MSELRNAIGEEGAIKLIKETIGKPAPEATKTGGAVTDKNYDVAQEVNDNVAKANPDASVLLTPKGDDLSLTSVYVGKEKRGKGIGTKVLETVKSEADRTGKKIVLDATNELDTETDLERLSNFYEKNGFTKVGDNKFEYNPQEAKVETKAIETKTEAPVETKVEAPALSKKDQEEVKFLDEQIQSIEMRIEDLQEEIQIEKGNLKEEKERIKQEKAKVRSSKMSRDEKQERIEELDSELEDIINDHDDLVQGYKDDISQEKSDLRRYNKDKGKITERAKTEAPTETKADGSNPELVKAVEDIIGKTESKTEVPRTLLEESINAIDSMSDGETLNISNGASITKNGNEYEYRTPEGGVKTINKDSAIKVFNNNTSKARAGKNISLIDYDTKSVRANNLDVGDVYVRDIDGVRYVYRLLEKPRIAARGGQFRTANVEVLHIGNQPIEFLQSTPDNKIGKVSEYEQRVGKKTIDTFKAQTGDSSQLGNVKKINNWSSPTPTTESKANPFEDLSSVTKLPSRSPKRKQAIADFDAKHGEGAYDRVSKIDAKFGEITKKLEDNKVIKKDC